MFFQSKILKDIVIKCYGAYARKVSWYSTPRVFLNSFPKAGTHLLTTYLDTMAETMNSGQFIWTKSIHNEAYPWRDPKDFVCDEGLLRKRLGVVRKGQYVSAHFPWRPEMLTTIKSFGFSPVYIIRDPRDMLVSRMYYILGLKRHRLHHRLVNDYPNNDERLMACINGVDPRPGDVGMLSIDELLREMAGWWQSESVYLMHFESLIGKRGGGCEEQQFSVLKELIEFIGRDASDNEINRIITRVEGKGSFTFRKGVIGDWKNHFNDSHIKMFEERAGTWMKSLGYDE